MKVTRNTSLTTAISHLIVDSTVNNISSIQLDQLNRFFNLFGDVHIKNTINQVNDDIKRYNDNIENIQKSLVGKKKYELQTRMYPSFKEIFK